MLSKNIKTKSYKNWLKIFDDLMKKEYGALIKSVEEGIPRDSWPVALKQKFIIQIEKDGKITEDFCKELAERQPMRVVFRDSGFASDSVKINVEQIFKQANIEVKVI